MTVSSRVFSRMRGSVLVLAASAVLVACNPLGLSPDPEGQYAARYTGPSGGWLEVSVAGTQGLEVSFYVFTVADDLEPRYCRDGAGAPFTCGAWGNFHISPTFPVAWPGYRSVFSPLDGDEPTLFFSCTLFAQPIDCPVLQVTVRVVDEAGNIVGDLRDPTQS